MRKLFFIWNEDLANIFERHCPAMSEFLLLICVVLTRSRLRSALLLSILDSQSLLLGGVFRGKPSVTK